VKSQQNTVLVSGTVSPKMVSVFKDLKITVKEHNLSYGVDQYGSFCFNTSPGTYHLEISLNNQVLTLLPVEIKAVAHQKLGQLDIPYHQVIEEVVVTGQHNQESVRNSVYQVRVINNERIQLRAPINVQEMLSTELG